ncbi:MAG: rod shape-determining protein MreD [Christensenellaceae bacterium]|jgi:rod shape-determining protein MreD|nr:rod shape-determining protein MreD [Christensenellaceae bacterium]
MYRTSVLLSVCVAFFLDSILFARFNIMGIRPDCLLAVMVSLGILLGPVEGAIIGCVAGLLFDVLFGRAIGLYAMAHMLAGAAGGLFFKKFYADNLIIPGVLASIAAFVKENIMAVSVRLMGGSFGYIRMLITYMVPCALLTGVVCVLAHLWLKPAVRQQVKKRYERHAGGSMR